MSDWWWATSSLQKKPHLTKKQRKAILRGQVAANRWRKWWRAEPPRWRIFARWRWKRNEPKVEG